MVLLTKGENKRTSEMRRSIALYGKQNAGWLVMVR